MSKGFTFLKKAEEDIEEILRYISQDNPTAALAVRKAIENTCETLASMPEIGTHRRFANPVYEGIRLLPVKKFGNYLIFYRPTQEGVLIIRVLHAARDIAALFEEKQNN
jgi:toxin ParE1/3/4